MEIEALHEANAELIAQLNALFDEGCSWDAEQGRRFLANPDNSSSSPAATARSAVS